MFTSPEISLFSLAGRPFILRHSSTYVQLAVDKQLQLQNTRMKRLLGVTIFCNFQVLFSQKKENIKTMGMTKSSDDIGNIV